MVRRQPEDQSDAVLLLHIVELLDIESRWFFRAVVRKESTNPFFLVFFLVCIAGELSFMWDLLSCFIGAEIGHMRGFIVRSPDWLFSQFGKRGPCRHMGKKKDRVGVLEWEAERVGGGKGFPTRFGKYVVAYMCIINANSVHRHRCARRSSLRRRPRALT